jgi:hypothetical protein
MEFSARSPAMTVHATVDTATEERCFLCSSCLDVISRTISEVQLSKSLVKRCEVKSSWLVSE